MASTNRSLFFSDQFAISCGTVSLDLKQSKVLLIRWRKTGEYMLPKGHKDLGESLERTALRETFEETGVRAQLLPVDIVSLATSVKDEDHPKVITEPIAVSQRMAANGVLKIIFWYVAVADSTITPEEGTQQENEDFETVWADFENADTTLSHEDDQRIARAAIEAARHGVTPAC
ncbi:hypothetical protein FSARC_13731 [Fusarium sarcochroum]|uniref:Nudix hydrolase domain-containing protein n=1 Tax=Fusarium sarcochroum TaxID=1208366 RepID=A0A8H4SZM2_9HYPO|nr:hypothetical protein FSARC_13731 [Fusarium sarcochroum]